MAQGEKEELDRNRRFRMKLLVTLLSAASAAFAPPYAVLNYSDFARLVRDTAARPDIKNYR